MRSNDAAAQRWGFPFGAGRFSATTSSLVLDVALRLRRRPRSSSRSKIASARCSPYSAEAPWRGECNRSGLQVTPACPAKLAQGKLTGARKAIDADAVTQLLAKSDNRETRLSTLTAIARVRAATEKRLVVSVLR